MKRILIPLAPGFEEIEAVTLIDVLRRAGLEVVVAALGDSGEPVPGGHGIPVAGDVHLKDVDPTGFDAVVLPGGMAGTEAMMADEHLLGILRRHHGQGKLLGAICAAPMVLAAAQITSGHELTSYPHPDIRGSLGDARVLDGPRVVRSNNVITSQGPGTAMEFALALVEDLVGPQARAELAGAMVVAAP